MTDNLTDDDSEPESHCSKTCVASSYGQELQRLNELDASEILELATDYLPDAIALANKLHALLVQAEETLQIYANRDLFVGPYYPSGHSEAEKTLAAIRDAGIGGGNAS